MHGGAAGSGAPKGNRNALKNGFEAMAQRKAMRDLIRQARKLVEQIE